MAMAKDRVLNFSKAVKQHYVCWLLRFGCPRMNFFEFFFIISDIEVLCLRNTNTVVNFAVYVG
jgi:hypothetical protein